MLDPIAYTLYENYADWHEYCTRMCVYYTDLCDYYWNHRGGNDNPQHLSYCITTGMQCKLWKDYYADLSAHYWNLKKSIRLPYH
jgi:hypothetical protein